MIERDLPCSPENTEQRLFKASLTETTPNTAHWNKLVGWGDSPNDAHQDLYKKVEEAAHADIVDQIDSLSNSNVKVVICDDAETITDEDIEKAVKRNDAIDSRTDAAIKLINKHKPDLDTTIFKDTIKHMIEPERKEFIQEMLNELKEEDEDEENS